LLALVAAFAFFLEGSKLEAERLNVGTLLGGGDPDPQIELWVVGIVLGVFALLTAVAASALKRFKR
jgi:hypothetical protein